ncbi:beta-glucosidase family protein [Haloferax sp. DFSO52]|uniref:beta-glucosidase n=1 Tax=Haloferax sp. DFSO52 TaxID=3388505 RepID=UPI003A87BA8E
MSLVPEEIEQLIEELTLEEKIQLVHGEADPEGLATGYLSGVERLGIPELRLADGPLGVRARGHPATLFPASIALAATFDPNLGRKQGVAMGREAKARKQDALLGPGVNLIRVPHCGRNFEYYSEDPVLTAAFAHSMVTGIQSEDVIATPKHYVANNQETNRASVDVDVSERALRECYLPGFKAAVDAGAGSVMTAYNSVNGSFMSENRSLVTDVLKSEWGFDGYVVSDWFGTVSTVGSANGGLDLEMPGITREEMWEVFGLELDVDEEGTVFDETEDMSAGMPDMSNTKWFAEPLAEAVRTGEVPEERVDDMVTRILRQMDRIGLFEGDRGEGNSTENDHRSVSESIAARGTVLLENDGVLPLADGVDIAVVGPGVREITTGGGSSEMDALYEVSTAEGIEDRANGDVLVERGLPKVEQVSFFGRDEDDTDQRPDPRLEDAVEAAATAEVAVVVVQDAATEARDRENLRLPGRQDQLVEEVAAVNENTVVVVQSSGPVELPWRSEVAAVLESWYPGQSDGDALAAVLFGDVDASGRLPVTFANERDYPTSTEETFPGAGGEVHYTEDLFVGYKHFDVSDVEPTYPFGHGLSYAEFSYHSVEAVDERQVRVTIENTADREGREVVQAYVSSESVGEDRPVRELAGFVPVDVQAGEIVTVDIDLEDLAFAQYDDSEGWTDLEGPFTVEIARSAGDTRLEVTL